MIRTQYIKSLPFIICIFIVLGQLSTAGLAIDMPTLERIQTNNLSSDKNTKNILNNNGSSDSPDIIFLPRPELKALISIDTQMDPYALEAESQSTISLRQALQTAVDHNLDIGIASTERSIKEWDYRGSLGKFLPDAIMGYNLIGTKGSIRLPIASGIFSGTSSAPTVKTGSTLQIHSPFTIASAGFSHTAYQGGKVYFGALQSRHEFRASQAQNRSTLSDTLLKIASDYYNLLLNEALLQIRIRATEVSAEQLRINSQLASQGLATSLDVLQSKTQLSHDRQNLVDQQIARRTAALKLAEDMNTNQSNDLTPAVRTLQKMRLLDNRLKIATLLSIAIDHRPELKQYEELRLAAKKAITVAAAPLQPTVKLGGNIYGIGGHINNLDALYVLNFGVNWTFKNLGTSDYANVQSARWLARQRLLEANKELIGIINAVRNSLLDSLRAERKITETEDEVASSKEELRLAKIRFENGLGNNIDVINAQRDLTTALIDRAQAIINFNISQSQLVHDVGLISIDNLTSGRVIQRD